MWQSSPIDSLSAITAGSDNFTLYDGSEFTVLERPGGPGDRLVMRFVLIAGCGSPPPHVHPDTTETFEVEEGEFELLVGKDWKRLGAGESVEVPAGLRHTFRNDSGSEVVVRNTHDPHHDFEAYLRRIAALSHELESAAPDSPGAAMRMALLWGEYDHLIRPADPPMKLAMPLLRGLGRLTGKEPPGPGTLSG